MNISFQSFDLLFVSMSFFLSVFGSYTALSFAIRIPSADKQSLPFWLITAAVALGGGAIWSMHFVGMMALNTPIDVSYDLFLTLSSLVMAIIACLAGLYIVGRSSGEISMLILGGCLTGLGVACMHYLGMAAMIMPAEIEYNTSLVLLSITIALIAATTALWLAFNTRGILQRAGSSLIMGIAVCGMHYVGMLAVNMKLVDAVTSTQQPGLFKGDSLAVSIFAISIILMFLLLMIQQFRLKQLS